MNEELKQLKYNIKMLKIEYFRCLLGVLLALILCIVVTVDAIINYDYVRFVDYLWWVIVALSDLVCIHTVVRLSKDIRYINFMIKANEETIVKRGLEDVNQ